MVCGHCWWRHQADEEHCALFGIAGQMQGYLPQEIFQKALCECMLVV